MKFISRILHNLFSKIVLFIKRNQYFCLVLLGILIVRVILSPYGPIVYYPDTVGYVKDVANERPFVYSKIIKLCRVEMFSTGRALLYLQTFFSLLTLVYIAGVGCRLFSRNSLRICWISFFFVFSLSGYIFPWEPIALPDAFDHNGMIILFGGIIVFASQKVWNRGNLFLLAFVSIFLMFLRDTNVLLGALILGIVFLSHFVIWVQQQRNPRDGARAGKGHALKELLWSPVTIFALIMVIAMGAKAYEFNSRQEMQQVNLASFISERVLKDPELTSIFIEYFKPPQAILAAVGKNYKQWVAEDNVRWLTDVYKKEHFKFLLKNYRVTIPAYNKYFNESMTWVYGSDWMHRPKAYILLIKWGYNPWPFRPLNWRIEVSRSMHAFISSPVLLLDSIKNIWPSCLPFGMLLATGLFNLKLNRAWLLYPMLFLVFIYYSHSILATFYVGGDDYRHFLPSIIALVFAMWLFAFAILQKLGELIRQYLFTSSAEIAASAGHRQWKGEATTRRPRTHHIPSSTRRQRASDSKK